ncbi:HesB/YadR/YfhF family protein [Paenibacillus thermoaerophilus]|uniref:HesB/YadR/YfhF family protein n=1 Tax=Paenibacillus thermoaerophilus TaxID=1215385 RepID=A0ABW2UYP8_9BACL|nr:Fe-S cluster assembly protein HesB [Paenibacillus thermoaerophilus]TMV10439.1 Fe-S cluster assembly protein HesB [Paenibacillus thermoaerophilus]
MTIRVTTAALERFKKEWGYNAGDRIRIYVRYSGGGDDAFSFGITRDTPQYPGVAVTAGDIFFFMEQSDMWYLDNRDLTLDLDDDQIVFLRG